MRSATTLAALLSAALLVPLTAGSASGAAAGEPDWRATACSNGGVTENATSGPSTLVASSLVPADDLPGVEVGVDRLDFSGVTCEVLYVHGALRRGATVSVVGNSWCARFDYALDGVPRDEGGSCTSLAGPTRLYTRGWYDVPGDVQVLGVETYRAHESRVVEEEPGMPAELIGATFTTTYLGTRWSVELGGTTLERQPFDRTAATDRDAESAYDRRVARAERVHALRVAAIEGSDRRESWKRWKLSEAAATRRESVSLARQRYRLALDGVRLVSRKVDGRYSGTLVPTP